MKVNIKEAGSEMLLPLLLFIPDYAIEILKNISIAITPETTEDCDINPP